MEKKNKTGPVRVVEEPLGFDNPPTERIPVQGDATNRKVDAAPPLDRSDEVRAEPPLDAPVTDRRPASDPFAKEDRPEDDLLAHNRPADDPLASDRPEDDLLAHDRPGGDSLTAKDRPADERDGDLLAHDRPGDGLPKEDAKDGDLDHKGTDGHSRPDRSITDGDESAPPVVAAAPPVDPGPGSDGPVHNGLDEEAAARLRARWREVQADFVDDPSRALRGADDLVEEVMRDLTERKHALEEQWRDNGDTEELRVALREYRSFFDRLVKA